MARQVGALERARGDLPAARRHGRAGITAAQEIGDLGLVAAALAFFGDLEIQAGRDERGIRLLGAESAWRAAPGARRYVSFWSWPAPDAGEARARMGEAAFIRAWTSGQRMTLEQAVAEALEEETAPLHAVPQHAVPDETTTLPPLRTVSSDASRTAS